MSALPPLSSGTLMAGKILYDQFISGNRTGLEPVLMAACVPARPGQRVAEIGCGAGAGLLCLSQRITGLNLWGIEADSPSAALAQHNLDANGRTGVTLLNVYFPQSLPPDLPYGRFDHCFANPPWHDTDSSASPMEQRDLARRAMPDTLESWIKGATRLLRYKGSLTLALPATQMAAACTFLTHARFGDVTLCPLWPKIGRQARLMLIQARYGVKSPSRILPGLVLHQQEGGFTPESRTVLKEGSPLILHRQQTSRI
ncbi:tRNA1(Val) (adenine(37)-N6)-methyltransferase [Acetobacter orientalis]|uniref:tRNA1(Val) (adenine(37)-N6)-methyltransferase n=1 Tax=Acetobacter orientalis TaxID=146474 RepID=UPI0024203CFC|nr:methyltransferase [Acetobacter orientalis]